MGSFFSGDAPSVPAPTDIFKANKKTGLNLTDKQLTGVTGYYGKALPAFMDLASQYAPGFIKQGFDFGNLAMGGFEGMQTEAGGRAADTMANLRAKELGLMTGQAGGVRGLMESLSPEQAAAVSQANRTAAQAQGLESDFMGRAGGMMGQYGSQVGQYGTTLGDISGYAGTTISDAQSQELASGILGGVNPYVSETISGANADVSRANQMAQEAFARRGTLSPEEQRASQQQAREAFSASGRLGGNAAVAAEIQNREAAKAARRGEAAQLGQQAFSQQLGAAGQQMAAEQALYGQRGSNIERDIQLQQTRSNQALNAAQQRLATQQARYSQLGSEQERELARRQNLFSQDIAGGAQRAQERQLGFSQLMDVEQQRARLREEAAQAGQRSYGMAGGFYTTPGLDLLRQTPTSYTAGTNLANIGLNLGETMSPQLDYNLGLNLARERAGALDAQNMAQFQADMQAKAARNEMIGNMVQGGVTAFAMSDRRLKTDIKRVGTTDAGLPVYTYKYKGDNTTQMGVMAQDVEKVNPEAVAEFGGFKAVNYSLIK
jgi:hypothetical protein